MEYILCVVKVVLVLKMDLVGGVGVEDFNVVNFIVRMKLVFELLLGCFKR